MRILCPAGNVLHTDATIAVALNFLPVLNDSLELIDDKQVRVSTDADYIVLPNVWKDWSYSLALANRLTSRIASLKNIDKVPRHVGVNQLMSAFGPEIDGLFVASLSEVPELLEKLHANCDKAFNTSLYSEIIEASKKDALVLGSSREQLIRDGVYSDEYDAFFEVAPKPYIRIEIKDQQGKFFDLYLPHNDEQCNSFFEIVNNSEIQLPVHASDAVADFVADSDLLLSWFNDVFSFYRLKLKIETYREIKFIEKDNEDFMSQVESFDEIIKDTSSSNQSNSDTNYFLLNKISGILNAFGYEQQILHAVTDFEDLGQSSENTGYFMVLV